MLMPPNVVPVNSTLIPTLKFAVLAQVIRLVLVVVLLQVVVYVALI